MSRLSIKKLGVALIVGGAVVAWTSTSLAGEMHRNMMSSPSGFQCDEHRDKSADTAQVRRSKSTSKAHRATAGKIEINNSNQAK